MTPVPFRRVAELVAELRDLDPLQRSVRLDEACADQPELRAEVESLLAHAEDAPDFLAQPLLDRLCPAQFAGSDATQPALPDRIGGYRIVHRLATGGMGIVYLAEQDHPRRPVALKTVRRQLVTDANLRRFRQEAELLGRLQHPGIAQIFEAGTFDAGEGRQPFFAMEFVEGVPLTTFARQRRLAADECLQLFVRVCDAVHHAHQKGVVHRDLKPDNILVQADGLPKILDFGIARAIGAETQATIACTEPGQLLGTLSYMSPEQVLGDPARIDARSDVYALGVLLFELLGGRPPLTLDGQSIHEAARIIREEEPTRLGTIDTVFRGDLEIIVDKALQKDADRRYRSAQALGDDLRRHLAHAPIAARPPSTWYQLRKFARRHKALVGGVAASLCVAVIGAIVATAFAVQAARNATVARRNEDDAVRAAARANVVAAAAILDREPRVARRHLDDVPPRLRRWEWHHLAAGLEPVSLYRPQSNPGPPRSGAVAFLDGDRATYAWAGNRGVQFVDLQDGRRRNLDADSELADVTFARDGSRLAAVTADRTRLLVWNTTDGTLLLSSPPCEGVRDPSFSADGRRLAFVTDTSDIVVLEIETGSVAASVPAHRQQARWPVLDAEGTLVAAKRGEALVVVDGANGTELFEKFVGGPCRPVFDWSGQRIAVGAAAQTVRIYDASTLEILAKLPGDQPTRALAFAASDRCLATASRDEIRVWDLEASSQVRVIGAGAVRVAMDRGGTHVAAVTPDGGALWDVQPSRSRILSDHTARVLAIAFTPDSATIATAGEDRSVRLWEAATGNPVGVLEVPAFESSGHFVEGLAFSTNGGSVVAVLRNGRIFAWDTTIAAGDGRARRSVDDFWSVAVPGCRLNAEVVSSADGSLRLVKTGRDVRLLDARTGSELAALPPQNGRRTALAISRDASTIASGEVGGVVRLWTTNGTERASVTAHGTRINAIDFSPDGTRLVTAGTDFSVRVWDVETLEQVAELRGHSNSIRCVAFSPDGTQIASGSSDATVRIWDSLPGHRRHARALAAQARREAARPIVDRLLAELGTPAAVAARLRQDPTLDEPDRAAALRVLAARCRASAAGSPTRSRDR